MGAGHDGRRPALANSRDEGPPARATTRRRTKERWRGTDWRGHAACWDVDPELSVPIGTPGPEGSGDHDRRPCPAELLRNAVRPRGPRSDLADDGRLRPGAAGGERHPAGRGRRGLADRAGRLPALYPFRPVGRGSRPARPGRRAVRVTGPDHADAAGRRWPLPARTRGRPVPARRVPGPDSAARGVVHRAVDSTGPSSWTPSTPATSCRPSLAA